MMIRSPIFIDQTGYFPEQNIDTEFRSLNDGLNVIRQQVGEDLYFKLREMSDRMRGYFEADPQDETDDTLKGREIVAEMEGLLIDCIRNS